MTLEKIFKREDGTQYKIMARVYVDPHSEANYDIEVIKCLPRKRAWFAVHNFDSDYIYRAMNKRNRENFRYKKYLEVVTAEEIELTLLELWNTLKPTKFYGDK